MKNKNGMIGIAYLCSRCGAIHPKNASPNNIIINMKNFFCISKLLNILSNPRNKSMKNKKNPIINNMYMGDRTNRLEYPS